MGALVLGEEVCCFLSFFFTLYVVEPCGVQDEKKGELNNLMSKSYLALTHQPLACWVFFWCLWRPFPMRTWWNRQGERCPWVTCFWGSVLVPLGPVSFICISLLLYLQPPTLSFKDTLDKLSDQGMLDSQWLPTQLSWKERQAIENLQPVFLGSSLIEEEGKGQRWVSYITVSNRLFVWSVGIVAELDIVHSVCWPSGGCQVHLGSHFRCQRVRSPLPCQRMGRAV